MTQGSSQGSLPTRGSAAPASWENQSWATVGRKEAVKSGLNPVHIAILVATIPSDEVGSKQWQGFPGTSSLEIHSAEKSTIEPKFITSDLSFNMAQNALVPRHSDYDSLDVTG
jgi:hypothetical protein